MVYKAGGVPAEASRVGYFCREDASAAAELERRIGALGLGEDPLPERGPGDSCKLRDQKLPGEKR